MTAELRTELSGDALSKWKLYGHTRDYDAAKKAHMVASKRPIGVSRTTDACRSGRCGGGAIPGLLTTPAFTSVPPVCNTYRRGGMRVVGGL